jgi:AbrB family looped-hinge helix DNA binding protein
LDVRARVCRKGRVTIPERLRERLGIRAGQILDFLEEEGRLVARKLSEEDPVDQLHGILESDKTTDEMIEELRGPLDGL